jgi:hypothetical protein
MTDAFDRFWEWRDKPRGSRLGIPGQLYGAVMSLPEAERSNRELVNEIVRANDEARREGRVIWVYFSGDPQHRPGDTDWAKLFSSPEAADRWFSVHDPEGVAWGYTLDEGAPQSDSVWLYVDERKKNADPGWIKPFAVKVAAEKWLETHHGQGRIWEYPVRKEPD